MTSLAIVVNCMRFHVKSCINDEILLASQIAMQFIQFWRAKFDFLCIYVYKPGMHSHKVYMHALLVNCT